MPIAPTPEELCVIEACREAARRYCYGVDRLDPEYMKSAYWPDGTDDHGTFVGNAHEFVDHCMESHKRWAFTMHSIYNHMVELDADGLHARGQAYNITHLQRLDSNEMDVWFGRYLDHYEKRGDEWRILNRVCVYEGSRIEPDRPLMNMDSAKFRQGSFDRPAEGRLIGP